MKWLPCIFAVLLASLSSSALADGTAVRPLVVLDPGHGGTNSGGPTVVPGLYEKDITLALARSVAAELEEYGIDVVLTRDRDIYLTLRQRVRRANELGADLFLSLHTNATESHGASGFETFVLSADGLDIDTRALRAADGRPRPGLDRDTAELLDDLERGEALGAAADLGVAIQRELRRVRGAAGDRGVRQAPMDVLMGATMPAVLVEVGFADHPVEGRELLDPEVGAGISAALAAAVAKQLGLARGS